MVSRYPNGFSSGVEILGMPVLNSYAGNVFWVDSGGSNASDSGGNDGSRNQPFATIDYAIGRCTASNGDIIMVAPGHSETITADGGVAMDVAGVAVVGTGRGSLRAKIVLDAAAAAITVSAADCLMQNVVIEASFADVTNGVDVTSTDFKMVNCEFSEEGADLNFLDFVVASGADNTADGLALIDCFGTSIDAGTNSPLRVVGDMDRLVMKGCYWNLDNANALAMIQCATGKDLTDCIVEGNRYASLKTSGDILIDNDTTANSGWVANNFAIHADTAGEVLVDCDGVGLFENYATAVVTASGFLLPAADS